MDTIAVALHVFICLFLIALIMLQTGKGADVGAVFGGASQTFFGGRGPATFLNKLTIIVSVIFLLTSVWLSKIGSNKGEESVIGTVPITTPATTPAPVPVTPEVPVKEKR
ncbi:MAG: preprotein translocase subunit SecG [Deltaproteobacteria bacterium]|nr:preprotein translocase subunit SecG [Deltaproteobacteria bacterium]